MKRSGFIRSIARVAKFGLPFSVLLAAGWSGGAGRVAMANARSYIFQVIATIPGPAPGPEGGDFTFDFEPYGITNSGKLSFVADVTTGGEGVFLLSKGKISQLARTGEAAPGGGTFDAGDLGRSPLNAQGDLVFGFILAPFTSPIGFNSGLYYFSHLTGAVTNLVEPFVTPAPGGGQFQGIDFDPSLNNLGDIVFGGIVPTQQGISGDLGLGVFEIHKGQISSVVSPGDPAPGGGTFDMARAPWVSDPGDIGFGAHVRGEECIDFGVPQSDRIFCAESVYVRKATTGEILSIAHQGDPAPGGGVFSLAFGAVLNSRGDIAFIGDLTPSPKGFGDQFGVFLNAGGINTAVARPGDPMPGGGHFVTASSYPNQYHLNNRGQVVFNAALDTDVNADAVADTGLYLFWHGSLSVVARTGTIIPGVGTIAHIAPPGSVSSLLSSPLGYARINEIGQVFFEATLDDGTGVLLMATPTN